MIHGNGMVLAETVKNYAKKLGVDLVGIASVENYKEAPDIQKPTFYLLKAKSLISIGMRVPDSVIDNLPHTRKSYTATYNTINEKLNYIAYKLARLLESKGYPTLHFPAGKPYNGELNIGDISHRHVALKAGLGEVSYSGLLLTHQYGPRIRLNTVITEAELKPDPPYQGSRLCQYPECNRCVEICPPRAQASTKIEYVYPVGRAFDKYSCRSYMDDTLKGLVCGMCIKVCPAGEKGRYMKNKTIL